MDPPSQYVTVALCVGAVSAGLLCMWIGAQHWLFMPGKSHSVPDAFAHWCSLIGMRMQRDERMGEWERYRERKRIIVHTNVWEPGLNFPPFVCCQGTAPKYSSLLTIDLVVLKFNTISSHLAHVLAMTTFYSSHENGCRRADSCERRNASHVQVNLRQNPPSTSILKQTHLQQMVTQDGSIHPICYNPCTLPLNIGKTRTKFLNLRDSVKKSPTKSTVKVSGPGERFSLWPSVSFDKVR